jgi:SAM-dependent methyltransferase
MSKFHKVISIFRGLIQEIRETDNLPHYRSVASFTNRYNFSLGPSKANTGTKTLDLGCGHNPRNPFNAGKVIGIDIRRTQAAGVTSLVANLAIDKIPLCNEAVDFVTAFDFIEHIPRFITTQGGSTGFPFVSLMDEISRVLKDGGIFFSMTPAYPYKAAFADPTHINIITEHTFPVYFCTTNDSPPIARAYGFNGDFKLINQGWMGSHLLSLLRKG